ncbi:MAG: hypothetical protein HZA51_00805 [Planctomycetes bacterium]|nr:hypothetical protein [Planctomycetota bacterium]
MTLDYAAPAEGRFSLFALFRPLLIFIAIVAPLLAIVSTIGSGSYGFCCARCGATATVRDFEVCGFRQRYGWQSQEGPISKFIQDGTPCAHQWEVYSGGSSGLTWRACVLGRGLRHHMVWWVECEKDIDKVLEQRQAADSWFRDSLKAALANPKAESSSDFMLSLLSNRSFVPW